MNTKLLENWSIDFVIYGTAILIKYFPKITKIIQKQYTEQSW